MRVPLNWLRDYVDIELTPEELAERLTLLGMEVKGIEEWGADWRSVVVGELLTVERHPRADRLSLTTVRVGAGVGVGVGVGEVLEIVCGATNIAPGQRVPVALPGAVLPGGRRIELAQKMGVTSNGMLCSGAELELTGDADGILILDPSAPLGVSLQELYGDVVLDVDVKPNRGDALCLVGLAREVAATTGAQVRWPDITVVESGRPISERLAVRVEDVALCSRFVARWVAGVRVGPSPEQVQMRLRAAGMRPVSNVVDAANYVMLELGKPTHTFDAAAVHDGQLIVRPARPGERLETLDHVERALDADTLLIADPVGALAIAGIMGGAASEVGEGTTDVIVESAVFDPISIRRTGQRHALRSEASVRFEKGQEPRLARLGADRVAQLVAAWAGGSVAPGRLDSAPVEPEDARLAFRPARVNRLLGTDLSAAEQRELLARVGVASGPASEPEQIVIAQGLHPRQVETAAGEVLVATIPSWRRDLAIEADIAEEIARVRGYELLPAVLPHTPMPSYRPSPLDVRHRVRDTLAGAGLSEVVTSALVSPRLVEAFPVPGSPVPVVQGEDAAEGAAISLTNPLSSQHAVLRQSLLGSLLEVLASNLRNGRERVAIFEIGKGYGRVGEETREWWRLGFALCGTAEPPAWNRAARPYDLDDAKGIVELLCARLGFGAPLYAPLADEPTLHPGRAARVIAPHVGGWTSYRADLTETPSSVAGQVGGSVSDHADPSEAQSTVAGQVGEIHPSVLSAWDLRVERVIVGELAIAGLSGDHGLGHGLPVHAVPIARHPAVERDIAVVVPLITPAAAVAATIRAAAGPLLIASRLFDLYRGAPLAADEKSLAERLVFQAADRTLTDAEVDSAIAAITAALVAELGARLRS